MNETAGVHQATQRRGSRVADCGAAQQSKLARVGFLGLVSASSHASRVAALRAGLRDLGWIEGRNVVIEFRWAEGNYERLPALAEELVRLNVDVLVPHGSSGALAAMKATSTVPIVITAVADLLGLGLVESLLRPGGNITGLSFFNAELAAKRLELLKEAIPALTKAASSSIRTTPRTHNFSDKSNRPRRH